MELEISKRCFSHSFNRIWSKHYEDVGYYGGTPAIAFLGLHHVLQNFWHFQNFNMGVNGKILKCGICRKLLMVE